MSRLPGARARTALGALLLLAAVPAAADLPPVDEAASRPDFFTFRARLAAAVARHDVEAVLDAVHPRIRTSFGEGGGLEDFRRQWKPESPDSRLWAELGAILALGGTFDRGRFVAPYVFSRWPEELDAFEHAAVLGKGVRVRAAPGPGAAVIARLDFNLVRLVPGAAGQRDGWRAIRLDDGRTGWVAAPLLRSPLDYRAIFAPSGGRWQLELLVAGD